MKLPYGEGTWFAVPLPQRGFGVGIVARTTSNGKVILCYFFGPCRSSVPTVAELDRLKPSEALWIARVGDLSLVSRDWPIIGQLTSWNRGEWPMPPFIRRDPISHKAWRVHYSDGDPLSIEYEEPEAYENTALNKDSVSGSGAVELVLGELLA
jgi:immunity protein 26 of polymorphic toxin system